MPGEPTSRAGLGEVFRVREFRALWTAEVVSVAGDQLARVALTVLVYGRTGSAAWAALTYALTFLPALLGGILLARLADRHPRRELMIAVDLARAGLVAAMAAPGLPLPALCGLLVVVVLLAPAHSAAQGALLPEVLAGPRLEAGLAVRQITNQAAQVAGFAAGGLVVAAVGPPAALAVNAATFAVSALVLRLGVAARARSAAPPAAGEDGEAGPARSPASWRTDVREGLRAVLCHPYRRVLAAAVWLVGCYVVPEALAVPYAAELGAGPAVVGLLMAADPAGSVVGAWLFMRFVPIATRQRALGPLAVLAGVPLALCAFTPGVAASVALWAAAGACATACLVQAQADFVRATPDVLRGRAIGVAASGLITAQGVAVLLGGLAAEVWGARAAVVGCGVLGAVVAVGLALALGPARRHAGTGTGEVAGTGGQAIDQATRTSTPGTS
ncbi:MAG TPA: MFS transporter [Pseudonocardia sp.]|jgi:predicted MFS family arabinose efflux permease|nr:MFS transporter [Pseudonocardia sp.]